MRVLVLGSEGNLGRPLVRHLRERDYEVWEADVVPRHRPGYSVVDVREASDLADLLDRYRPDVVHCLSAIVSRVVCEDAPILTYATNLLGPAQVVRLCALRGAHLVHYSSSEVYGPLEGTMDERDEPRPNNRYGLSKLLAERIVEYEAGVEGASVVVVRPFMIYSEEETLGSHRSAMIRFAESAIRREPFDVHAGTRRSWLHVSDAVRSFEAAQHVVSRGSALTINVGHPDVRPISDLAELVVSAAGASSDAIRLVEQPERMTPSKIPALDRQRCALGVVPNVSLEEGVARVVARVRERASS